MPTSTNEASIPAEVVVRNGHGIHKRRTKVCTNNHLVGLTTNWNRDKMASPIIYATSQKPTIHFQQQFTQFTGLQNTSVYSVSNLIF